MLFEINQIYYHNTMQALIGCIVGLGVINDRHRDPVRTNVPQTELRITQMSVIPLNGSFRKRRSVMFPH